MTVDITQDEMNILNLNGISAEDVRANVEFSRATGMDDDAIRQQFSNTIEKLKPITKVSANDTGKIKEWQDKGAITPFELGQRRGVVFDGTYNNIDNSANLSPLEQKFENSAYNDKVEQRIQAAKNKKAERNKRVNEGTGSFFDRAGAALDRMGQASYQAQLNAPEDITLKMAGVNKPKEEKSGEINFSEALGNSFMTGSWLPFVGGYIASADTKKERAIEEKIRNGKPIRQDELNFINHRIEQRQEESVRGYTWGGHVADNFLPSLVRFGGEIATGQWILRGLGLASELPAGANLGQKVVHGLGEMGKTGLVNTVLPTGWSNTFENYQERMLQNEFDITDKGQIIFQESAEKPATAFMKSLGKTFVMFASEAAGEFIGLPVKGASAAISKYAGTPIGNYLKSNKILSEFAKKITPELSKLYEKINKLPIKGESVDWLKSQVKFDGFIEELGEEVLEDVLNLTIGTDNEERSLENYAKAIFKSPDEWAILAGAVALQGGTLSVASHLLGSHLEQNGATDEQIVEILQNLSEKEKEEMVDTLVDEGVLNIEETEEQHFEKTVSSVAESLLQSGKFKNKESADKAVRLGATMLESMSKKTGKSLDELIQEDMAEIEEIDESAYADENGRLYASIDNSPMTIGDKVNALLDEYDALGDEYDDIDDINNRIKEIQVLEDISKGETLPIEDIEFANDLIAKYEEAGDVEFANTVRNALNNENKEVHFQRADFAGAERDELISAAKEWKEKGTESKYFKNWFGDSKVVDENGQPLVVYHGTSEFFSEFDSSLSNYGEVSKDFNFFTNKMNAYANSAKDYADYWGKRNNQAGWIHEVYLSIENPLHIKYTNTQEKSYFTPVEYYDYNFEEIKKEYNNGNYDGIIIENTDKNSDDSIIYAVPKSEQIKSVGNRGTFDAENPNIYFQSAYHGTPHRFDEFSLDAIGTGEGAQAHGWGLYFAENKEVSEDYRKKLAGGYIMPQYNGVTISQSVDELYTSILISGKEKLKQRRENRIKEYSDYIKENEDTITPENKNWYKLQIKETKEELKKIEEFDKANYTKGHYKQTYLFDGKELNFKDSDEYDESDILDYINQEVERVDLDIIQFKKNVRADLQYGQLYKDAYNLIKNASSIKPNSQLFEVNIPESDVLLDEDKSFYEQPKLVQKAILNIVDYLYRNQYRYGNIDNLSSALKAIKNGENKIQGKYEITGGVIYNEIADIIGSAKNTSLMLNNRGIKGITYDGKQDGRCYVIFDDKAIEITQAYYQKKGQGLMDSFKNAIINIVKKIEDADENIFTVSEMLPHIPMFDSIQDFFADIHDVKIELVSDSEYKNGKYIPELDSVKINKDSLKIVNMPIGRIETLLHELQHAKQKRIYDKYQALLTNKSKLSAAEISEYETYCTNYVDTGKANREKEEFARKHRRELDKIKRLRSRLNDYEFRLELLRNENLTEIDNQRRELYNKYKNSFGEVDARETAKQLIYRMGYGEIYENQYRQFVQLQLHRRTESARGRGLFPRRGTGNDGRFGISRGTGMESETPRYFQEDRNSQETGLDSATSTRGNQTSTKQRKIFIDNDRADIISNRLEKVKGTFIPAENLIALFKDSDESTIIHEFAHWWLDKLVKYAAENEEIQDDLNEIRKFVRNNGEPFTSDQHERFARGFEAYMRTGSARTNRLKKLFEDFKNALLSLYDSIKELGFEEDEIPQINNLFERLLTTENQRIQAAVFDRCNSINAQIQEIRDNQEKEFAEIEEIERNNLERNLRDSKKTQQIKEYLRLAQKAASRVPKGVREYQERYRNATFQILEVATGYKRQFIANPKNWEIIEQKIADLDDQITTQDGMQANWREFYTDTGVSYDNDEVGGDYELAQQAFKTLTSGNYSPMNMEEEEIGRFFGMFDYLEGKVMTLKGENKSAAYEALCSLFNDIPTMPDEAMQELVDKLQSVGEKFLDQKSMEKNPALGIPNVSLSVQFRTYVTSKLHNMKAYDPESKRVIRLSQVNRLYTLLKFSNSVAETKQIIRTINNHAIEQLENRQKFILHKEIQKQVRINSKLIKVGALKRGKFDWKTNTVFSELQDLNRLSLEAAQKEYQRLINADSAVLGEERESIEQNPAASLSAPTEFQAILKTKFLEYKSNRVRDLNLAATRSLLEDIMELKFEGRRAKNKEELKKALSRYDYETDLVRVAYLNKNDKLANYLTRWTAGDTIFTSEGTLANWESLLNHIFDKNTAQKYSLLKTEADVEVYAHRKCLEFYNKALDIYGLRNKDSSSKGRLKDLYNRALDFDNTQPIIKLFQEYEDAGHTYKFKQNTYNKDTNDFVETSIDLTHSQLITLYAWSLNPELKKRIIVQFVGEPEDNDYTEYEEILNDIMFSKLSNQDKEFAQAMIDICDSMYNDTNEVFIRTTGLSLPRVENYIPSKTERIGSDLDMLHENVLRSTNPSFIKQRKTCRRIKMEPVSPLEIILPHINKTSRYIVMSEKVNFYNRIFQSPDVKAAILDIYGKKSGTKIYRILLNQLATSTYENYARAITVGKNLMDTIASNYITSRIGGNIKVFLSQLTSVINYSENMPVWDWAKGFKDALAHPKETVDFMFNNCEYLQARLAGNSQNEIIATLTNEADKMRSWRNFCTANTKYGDIIAIMFGGKPYVDYLMKNVKTKDKKTGEERFLTKEEAFERFVESTLRSQQSGHNSATSAWQKAKAQDALTRMIYAFNNTNFQYERKFIDALSNYHRKHITRKEFAKAFLVYKIFNPILFSSFLTNLSILVLLQNMFGGGDDDPLKTFGLDAISSIALSNWKAYGFLGIIANSLVSAACIAVSGDKFFESKLPLISDFEMSIQKLIKGNKLETSDYIEMIAGAADYTTGVAATRIYNSLGGVGDIAQGEFGKGFLRILGYGNYRAEVAATGQEPKKNKRK